MSFILPVLGVFYVVQAGLGKYLVTALVTALVTVFYSCVQIRGETNGERMAISGYYAGRMNVR